MGQPQHREIPLGPDGGTGMLQNPPQQRHCSSTTDHRQVNHAVAIPQDRDIESEIESTPFPAMNRRQHEGYVQTFYTHPTIDHEALPPSFGALRLAGATRHIGFPVRQAEPTAAYQQQFSLWKILEQMNCKRSTEALILSFKNLGRHGVRTPESSTNTPK